MSESEVLVIEDVFEFGGSGVDLGVQDTEFGCVGFLGFAVVLMSFVFALFVGFPPSRGGSSLKSIAFN